MTVEDAKKIARLEDALEFFKKQSVLEQVVSNDEKSRCFSLAVDALEKQIPKKPLEEKRYYGIGKCPTCNAVFMDNTTNYCGNCGQAIDWSDSE